MAKRFVLVSDGRYDELKKFDGMEFPSRDKAIRFLKEQGLTHWYRGLWVTGDPRSFATIEIQMVSGEKLGDAE